MKYLLILFFIIGCAQVKKNRVISKAENDSFKEESFNRYGLERLNEKRPIEACFKGKINQGLNHLKDKLGEQKNHSSYWNKIGTCYYISNNYPKANYYYTLANDTAREQTKRDYAPALNNMGLIKFKQGHYNKALDYFKKSSSANNYLTPKYNLAQVYLVLYRPHLAQQILEGLQRVYKGTKNLDSDLTLALAYSYLQQGKIKNAIKHLDRLKHNPRINNESSLLLAFVKYHQKKYYQAQSLIEKQRRPTSFSHNAYIKLKELINEEIERIEESEDHDNNSKSKETAKVQKELINKK